MSTSTVFEKPVSKVSQLINDTGFYVKPASGIPSSDIASGVIPNVPVQNVQIDGTSILSNGIADIPICTGSNFGVIKTNSSDGIGVTNGVLRIIGASDSNYKDAGSNYRTVTPYGQHKAVFYGLAKASGDTTQALSANTVGIYTPEAQIAIQKMLGLYEAPWELIREDTFTNETSSDHTITVDGNNQPINLTNIVMMFETPQQETYAEKGAYGQIRFYYNNSGNYFASEPGAWTQNANSSAKGFVTYIEQKDGLFFCRETLITTSSNSAAWRSRYSSGFGSNSTAQGIKFPDQELVVYKIMITALTGTGHYKLYGKRRAT